MLRVSLQSSNVGIGRRETRIFNLKKKNQDILRKARDTKFVCILFVVKNFIFPKDTCIPSVVLFFNFFLLPKALIKCSNIVKTKIALFIIKSAIIVVGTKLFYYFLLVSRAYFFEKGHNLVSLTLQIRNNFVPTRFHLFLISIPSLQKRNNLLCAIIVKP